MDENQCPSVHQKLERLPTSNPNGSYKSWKEAVVQTCSVKKVFLKILQNSQENTCSRDSFLIKFQALGLQFC